MAGPSILVRVLGDVTGLGKSFDDAGGKGTSAAGKMHTAFRGTLDALNQSGVLGPFGAALATADSAIQGVLGHGKELGPVMMGVGGAVAGVGLALTAMGSKDQAAHQQLQAAVEATGHSYDEYAGRVESTIKSQEKFGTTADKTQDSLRILTQATNDPTKALDDMQLAANLAAAKHEDLTTASGQLAKAMNGSGRILKEFGITTKDASGKTKDQSTIVAELSAKLSGQASASANTFTGHLKAMKASLEDNVAAFGQKYGPAITTAGVAMTGLGAAIQIVSAAQDAHVISTIASTVATGAQTAAQWALNIAMSANPIMLIVIAIAALVGAFILAYTHITIFRNIVNEAGAVAVAAFHAIVGIAQAVFGWIAANWPLLAAILAGPVGIAVYMIATHIQTILGFFQGLPGDIKNAVGDLGNLLYSVGADVVKGFINGIESMAGAVGEKIKSVVEAPINAAKSVLKIFSPSQVFADIGQNLMAGFHQGITAGASDTERIMANAMPNAMPAVAGGGAAPPGRTGPMVHVENVHVAQTMDVDAFMRRVAWQARTVAA